MTGKKDTLIQAAQAAEARHGIPVGLLRGLLEQESSWNPTAKSPTGPLGVAQLSRAAAKDLGVDPLKPLDAIDGAARLLRQHFGAFGDWSKAVRAYHDGAAGLRQITAGTRTADKESQNYVPQVLAKAAKFGAAPIVDLTAALGSELAIPVFRNMPATAIKRLTGDHVFPMRPPAVPAPPDILGPAPMLFAQGAPNPGAPPEPALTGGMHDLFAEATRANGALFETAPAFPDRFDGMIDQLIRSV